MSLRFLPRTDENGGVIQPQFWTEGASDMAGELNGGLDRDNFASASIAAREVNDTSQRQFTDTSPSYATDTNYTPDITTTAWQGGTGNDASGLGTVTWTAAQDSHYDIWWSGGWEWNGAYSWSSVGTGTDTYQTVDGLRIRILVDGVVVALSGIFEDGAQYFATYLCGSIQLPAGTHTLRIETEVAFRRIQSYQESIDDTVTNTPTFGPRVYAILRRSR